ncbi:hypothetical protein, partial [Oleiphilus sp. HI0125]|uniref:hypothetical protein n=1 Tax=Oleiphilus sp. HI0125 TaxID=1822266 RepID=UPI001E3D6223
EAITSNLLDSITLVYLYSFSVNYLMALLLGHSNYFKAFASLNVSPLHEAGIEHEGDLMSANV